MYWQYILLIFLQTHAAAGSTNIRADQDTKKNVFLDYAIDT
jgi:hypothetical protein